MQETWVQSLGWEDPLEEGMATHSSIRAWKIPWTEEPGKLQPMESQRVRHAHCLRKQLESESETHSVMSDSLQLHGLYSPWNFPSQNIGVGSHSLLQGIFPTQGSNPGLSQHRWILYSLRHQGSLIMKAVAAAAKSLQLCPTLWDPIDSSPPGSSIPGILQARTLEWVAISFSNA